MLKPGQSDKPPSTFWQRLYSTQSLLFHAILTVAIWLANMSAFYPSQPRKSAEEILGIQATPRRSAEESLGLTPSPSLTPIPFDEFTVSCRRQRMIFWNNHALSPKTYS